MLLPRVISACALVLLVATTTRAQINGSFEADAAGSAPSGWAVTGGTAIVQAAPDCLFPSHGTKYLYLNANASGPAVQGYGPHAAGTCAQVRQVVTRPLGQFCSLSVDWEFLPNETLPVQYNDFLSIDVINNGSNALIANVVYIDTGIGAGAPPYTNVPGAGAGQLTYVPNQSTAVGATGNQAPAGFKRALVDLSGVAVGTAMRIEISVGNGFDNFAGSSALIDRVRLSGGQQNLNAGTAGLRVLGSSHIDGIFGNFDWADDVLTMAPYTLRTCPGQRLSFRALGQAGSKWAMVAGALLDPGLDTPFGQINVDVFFGPPYTFVINGFSADPVSAWIGTMTNQTNWIDAQIPEATPLGSTITVQAGMEQGPGGPIAVSGATTIEVGAPQIPIGGAVVAGGAQNDDGSSNVPFGAFGAWPFYGVARPSVDVNSNGNVTFGGGDGSYFETEYDMLTGSARIAPAWDDMYPPGGGVVKSSETFSTYTVSWTGMEEYVTGLKGNNFAIQMYQGTGFTAHPAGVFTIYFGSSTMDDGLTGVTPGGLPAPAANAVSSNVNWSSLIASLGNRGGIAAGDPALEKFAFSDNGLLRDKFDLMTIGGVSRITFVPNGTGGYTYFAGTR